MDSFRERQSSLPQPLQISKVIFYLSHYIKCKLYYIQYTFIEVVKTNAALCTTNLTFLQLEGRKEGKKEGRKEGRKELMKEERKEERNEERKEERKGRKKEL